MQADVVMDEVNPDKDVSVDVPQSRKEIILSDTLRFPTDLTEPPFSYSILPNPNFPLSPEQTRAREIYIDFPGASEPIKPQTNSNKIVSRCLEIATLAYFLKFSALTGKWTWEDRKVRAGWHFRR